MDRQHLVGRGWTQSLKGALKLPEREIAEESTDRKRE